LNGDVSIRSEIWSLGTVFYEMLTGKSCFDYNDDLKVFKQQVEKNEFSPICDINPDIPESVAKIIHTMLRIGKGDEYAAMADVVKDIQVLVEPPREKEKIRWWQTALMVVFLSLTLLGGGYYAESVHLVDIPGISFSLGKEVKVSLPENIRKMTMEAQFQEALKAEKNRETYALAYRIFKNIETGSDRLKLRQRASYYKACLSLFRLEDYYLAIENFKYFLKKYPESQYTAMAHLYVGDCYLKINRIEKAVFHFDYVYNGFPDSETRETTRIFLQRARQKLKTQGDEIGFVAPSLLGRFLPNNKIGLIMLMLLGVMFAFIPIYWRQIYHWLDHRRARMPTDKKPGPYKQLLVVLVISILVFSIIILSNYFTHKQIYKNSIQSIQKIDISSLSGIDKDRFSV